MAAVVDKRTSLFHGAYAPVFRPIYQQSVDLSWSTALFNHLTNRLCALWPCPISPLVRPTSYPMHAAFRYTEYVNTFPYSIPSVGPGADPGVQAVSPQVTVSQTPGGKLLLFSARPAVTFPAAEHHRPLAGTELYCLVTKAHKCKQLAHGCNAAFAPSRI